MPTISAFPLARNHLRFAELIEATDSFFLETWPFESQRERDLLVQCHYGSFISKIIPDGDFEKMIWACRASTLLFLTDDWIEKQPHGKGSGLSDRIARIVRGEMDPTAGSLVEEMLNQIFRAIEGNTEVEQFRQLSHLTCECLRLQDMPAYENITKYLDFRSYNSGGYFALGLARYALNIYLTDDELEVPRLVICERLALDAIVMENDVASYEKEAEQNTLGNNLVARLLQHGTDGHTFTSASTVKVYLRERIADSEARLREAIPVALTDTMLRTSDAVRRWLHALPYIVSGSAWWSQHTGRYNIPGKPVPRRIIYLEGKGDIIVPEPQGIEFP
ncbi:isoprenoid synthase domain-containing protein [Mycena albidolilacea]|uniref:Terpene synthase n=1 Tax=Mycena albidolilacea TaxID=1033008 RepID=A0AAD7EY29_9AGAR|nr:isoprenoid synthase domain-containing protein [Mycena albidolilacea]